MKRFVWILKYILILLAVNVLLIGGLEIGNKIGLFDINTVFLRFISIPLSLLILTVMIVKKLFKAADDESLEEYRVKGRFVMPANTLLLADRFRRNATPSKSSEARRDGSADDPRLR